MREETERLHDEELIVERLLLVHAIGPGLARDLVLQERDGFEEPSLLTENYSGDAYANCLNDGVVVGG